MEKKENLKSLIKRLHDGEDIESVKKDFKRDFGHVSSSEIAQLEAALIEEENFQVEDIQRLCNVHADVFTGSVSDLHTLDQVDKEFGHPLHVFRKENYGLMEFLKTSVESKLDDFKHNPDESTKMNLLADIKTLQEIDKHYSRKENLFFPFLERAGVTGPPQVMWGVDDEIRSSLKEIVSSDLEDNELIEKIEAVVAEIKSMVTKENDILSPLLLKHIKAIEWLTIADASPTIGYAFNGAIEGASPSDAATWLKEQTENNKEIKDQEAFMKGEDLESNDGLLKFPSGLIKHSDMMYMLNSSPQDLTFIDADDKVAYFSETKDMMFARTRTIIGRDVRLCHPPKALPVVEQLLKDFKSGVKDVEERFILAGTKVMMVRYFAVRDDQGNYVGTLEATEEISHIIDKVQELKNKAN